MALVRSAVKPRAYWACTFEGLETKRQIYLKLVAERMAKQGFKRAEEWGERNLALSGSDAIFESADEKFLAGMHACMEEGYVRAHGFLQNLFDHKKLFTQHSLYIEVMEEDNK